MNTVETITLHSLVRIIPQDVKHADVSNLVGLEIVKMEKPKPKVTPIIIPDDKLQFLKKKLDDPDLSQSIKREFVKEIMGGECAMCQGMPTKIASYDMDGITLIEKYCDKCFEESKF